MFDPARHLSGLAFASVLPELVAERVGPDGRVLDLGTGCGLLAAAAREVVDYVVAIDIDPVAVAAAQRNLAALDVDVRCGDLFEPIAGERFDLVIANPPYEVGRARRPTLRSPDLLRRFGAEWHASADATLVAFPADDADLLASQTVCQVRLVTTVSTVGETLGVYELLTSPA